MSHIESHSFLSIVVPTRNNNHELFETIDSIERNCSERIQLVIVDGGNEIETRQTIKDTVNKNISLITYLRDEVKGVFPAQNLGIRSCKGELIMILNSGDLLSFKAKEILREEYLRQFSQFSVIVFSQAAYYSDKDIVEYTFTPTEKSIWPHQSVLVRRSVYEQFGLYREDYKYSAEQYYFAVIRRKVPFLIINAVLTLYKLGGISSKMSIKHSREILEVKRELGENILMSFFHAFVIPYSRILLEKIFGVERIVRLKHRIFSYYHSS